MMRRTKRVRERRRPLPGCSLPQLFASATALLLSFNIEEAHAWLTAGSRNSCVHRRRIVTCLAQTDSTGSSTDGIFSTEDDDLFLERFRRRRQRSKYRASVRRQLLPPNAALSEPTDFVKGVLEALRYEEYKRDDDDNSIEEISEDILYDSGPFVLLRSSTPEWFNVIRRFVGVSARLEKNTSHDNDDITEEEFMNVALALASALKRRDNQFNILLGKPTAPRYIMSFPSDPVEQDDDTCWLECRLRDADTDELLVVSGWDLKRREADGAWLLDGLDWQDFRDGFRPGIGREEWERICG